MNFKVVGASPIYFFKNLNYASRHACNPKTNGPDGPMLLHWPKQLIFMLSSSSHSNRVCSDAYASWRTSTTMSCHWSHVVARWPWLSLADAMRDPRWLHDVNSERTIDIHLIFFLIKACFYPSLNRHNLLCLMLPKMMKLLATTYCWMHFFFVFSE